MSEIDSHQGDLLGTVLEEPLGDQERCAYSARVGRIRVRVAPVRIRDVGCHPGDLRVSHRGRDFARAGSALVVDGRDDPCIVELANAIQRVVDGALVVTDDDVDAGSVGAASLVEAGG